MGLGLLTIHRHRKGAVGFILRIVDFANNQWRTTEQAIIWANAPPMQIAADAQMALNLAFGLASLLYLDNGAVLATHWTIARTTRGHALAHRLRVSF